LKVIHKLQIILGSPRRHRNEETGKPSQLVTLTDLWQHGAKMNFWQNRPSFTHPPVITECRIVGAFLLNLPLVFALASLKLGLAFLRNS
jgi:hypothetical protein